MDRRLRKQRARGGMLGVMAATALAASHAPASAAQDETLSSRIDRMERELKELKAQLAKGEHKAELPPADGVETAPPPVPRLDVSPRLSASKLSGTYLHVAGYADAGVAISDQESGTETAFASGTFNPVLHFQYKDFLLLESEAEISIDQDGETELELEYSQIDLLLHDYATLVIGKYLSPVGQFQERLHPSWINRLADAPAGFGHDGVQPAADVGLQLRGGVPWGRARFTYALAIGNGPRLDGAGVVMSEGFGRDDNDNKAISGRLGFLPLPYLELGASLLRAKVRGPAGEAGEMHVGAGTPLAAASVGGGDGGLPSTDVDFSLWGVDAAYTRGPWDVRFEYLKGERDPIITAMEGGGQMEVLPRLKLKAWYAQLAYRLSGMTQHSILQNFEPVVRYGEYKVRGLDELAEEAEEERWDAGLNYWFAPAIVLHGAVQRRNFTGRHEDEDNEDTRILLQLAYGF